MKASLLSRITLISLLALGTTAAFAKVISFNDLPAAVQREAQTELKNGPVKKIESVQQNGRTIYALTFQRADGSNKYIYLNADGTYVRNPAVAGSTAATTSATGTPVQMSQLPAAVQRTIQTEVKNGPVSQIQQLTNHGQVMYQVSFNQSNGQQKVIYLNSDGSYVQNNSGLASDSGAGLQGARTMNFSSLPAPVQNALRSQAGAARIRNIQQGQLNGQAVYQAAVNRNGQNLQIRVDGNGNVLSTTPLQSSSGNLQP